MFVPQPSIESSQITACCEDGWPQVACFGDELTEWDGKEPCDLGEGSD